jgi:hypothetical protein
MFLNAAERAALETDVQNIAVFFRLETEPDPVRLWLGFGHFSTTNTLDTDGAVYKGFGEIYDIPSFTQNLNGAATRVDFSISGVTGEVLAIASGNDAESIQGKRVDVGIGFFGTDWSTLLGDVHWCASYIADVLSVQQAETTDPEQPIIRKIVLSAGSRLTARRRPGLSYLTNSDQQAHSSGDMFCNLVGRYAHGFTKPWPQFT